MYLWLGEMKNTAFLGNSSAVSEVIGAIILVLIAVGAFAVIYTQVFPVQLPSPEPHVILTGRVTPDGTVVLEHTGGEILDAYEIHVQQSDGAQTYRIDNDPWEFGECYYPPINDELFNEEKQVKISVYGIFEDGSTQIVFDGILSPKQYPPGPGINPIPDPMSLSTLRTDTVDEDLICYSYSIEPNILPLTYIYNWMVSSTGPYSSLNRLLMPFDTQNPFQTKDYSANGYLGTINGATWINNGKLGGAYQYQGDDYIAIPYCFETNTINTITVEVWIKTSQSSGTILSYDRNDYWELAISNGKVKWSTNSTDGPIDLTGTHLVNDNTWHLIAATYNSATGICAIYIDGSLDITQQTHAPSNVLGSGSMRTGAIGKGTGVASRQTIFSTSFETPDERDQWDEHNGTGESQQATWTNLRYDAFNSGFGSYTDGGSDCYLTSSYKHEGTQSVCIRDNSGSYSAFPLTNSIDVDTPAYKSIKVDFWWMWNGAGWTSNEDWWLQYYNGTSWLTILDMNYPSGYSKNVWYHQIVYINESTYRFPTNMKIRFQCDASYDDDLVYFDEIYINATSWGRVECDFDLLPTTALTPKTGSFSLGGSGDFDPEYAAFNRSGVDLTQYTDVQISVWYSYKNTESMDFLGLYYKNNSLWVPIFEINNPTQVGQRPWAQVLVAIPESISELILQFKWRTTSASEYMAIEDLEITGVPLAGESNLTGIIDEVKIYPRVLSAEQLYQNYLCTKDGSSFASVLVSEETHLDETWKCLVTPNDSTQDDDTTESNIVYVINYSGGG